MADALLTISGNVVADPDLRFTPAGAAFVSFSVASTARVRVDNEWKDGETTFVRVKAWRLLAEGAADVLSKGSPVVVAGKLRQRSYEKDGEKKSLFELDADEIGLSVKARKQSCKPVDDPWGSNKLSGDEPPF